MRFFSIDATGDQNLSNFSFETEQVNHELRYSLNIHLKFRFSFFFNFDSYLFLVLKIFILIFFSVQLPKWVKMKIHFLSGLSDVN